MANIFTVIITGVIGLMLGIAQQQRIRAGSISARVNKMRGLLSWAGGLSLDYACYPRTFGPRRMAVPFGERPPRPSPFIPVMKPTLPQSSAMK